MLALQHALAALDCENCMCGFFLGLQSVQTRSNQRPRGPAWHHSSLCTYFNWHGPNLVDNVEGALAQQVELNELVFEREVLVSLVAL